MTIKVVVTGDHNFKKYVEYAKASAENLGYETQVYDLGNLGFGKPFSGPVSNIPLQTIPCKPYIILDALESSSENDYIVWLDADALMNERIDEIQDDYDIGVTVRPKPAEDPRVSMINAGILFVKNTPQAKKFLNEWGEKAIELNGDQWALNTVCNITMEDKNKIIKRGNTIIKTFPCEVYNNFLFAKNTVPTGKIIHYKSKRRKFYPYKV